MVLSSVAITGAGGMLGRHIVSALEMAGIPYVSCVRQSNAEMSSANVRAWDLTQWQTFDDFDALFTGVGAIVHAGAMVPKSGEPIDESRMFDANVKACLNLGEWALERSVPVVYISGTIVYANKCQDGLGETAPTAYTGVGGFYGLSKLLAEDIFHRLQQRGLLVAILRPTSVYGAGLASTKTMQMFLAKASNDCSIELTPPVDDQIDLIHAADVAHAVVEILKTEAWDTFNLASGNPVSVLEIANACLAVAGKGSVHIAAATSVRQPIRRFCLSCTRAEKKLGWRPQIGLEQGLKALLQDRVLTVG